MDNHLPRRTGLAILAALLALPSLGQPVPIPLHVTREIATPTIPAGVFSPALGNDGFYAEYSVPNVGPEGVIHWISEDGQRSILYDLAAVPRSLNRQDWSLQSGDYSAIPGGGVAALGVWHDAAGKYQGDSIVTFNQQGSPESVIDLSGAIDPTHIASFGEGTFLVLGGVHTGTGLSTSEIHLVDAHGTVLARHVFQKLDAPESPASPPPPAHDQAASGDKSGQQETEDENGPNTQASQLWAQVAGTALVPGDDANVYVIPPDQAAKVFVVNRGGEVTQLALDPVPELQHKNFLVMGAIERAGQLAIFYAVVPAPIGTSGLIRPTAKFICFYDVHIGALETTYQIQDPTIPGFLTGFDSGKFYFLSLLLDPATDIRQSAIVVEAP